MRVHQISIKFKYSGDKSVAKVRRNKDSLFPSPPVLCIVSVCEKKPERRKKDVLMESHFCLLSYLYIIHKAKRKERQLINTTV